VHVPGSDAVKQCECLKERLARQRTRELLDQFKQFAEADLNELQPRDLLQTCALATMRKNPGGSYLITSAKYSCGKTQLLVSQCRHMALAGESVAIRTSRQLVKELQRAEIDHEYRSEVLYAANTAERFHLFWDDCEKVGTASDFRQEAIFHLVDTIYRRKLSISITSNLELDQLIKSGRMQSAVARRIDDMCTKIRL
jgi:DNA replication protein DnaC